MREIKFRAWNEYAKTMYEVDLLHIRNRSQIVPTLHSDLQYMSLVYQPKTILMQYTGLKDKNGVPLYEGDIVKIWPKPQGERWSPDAAPPHVVKYVDDAFWLEPRGINWSSRNIAVRNREILVIGNIYEGAETWEETA